MSQLIHSIQKGQPLGLQTKADRKQEYRKACLAMRKASVTDQREHEATLNVLQRLVLEHRPHCVGIYAPYKQESPVSLDLAKWLWTQSIQVALPKVIDKEKALMQFYFFDQQTKLIEGEYGILETVGTEMCRPDMLIIPCVGYSQACHRLGYGKGYYDRFLSTYEHKPLTVGIAYESCLVPTDLFDQWDVPLDVMILGQRVLRA